MQDVNQFNTPQIHNLLQVAWKLVEQHMADLPPQLLITCPPFTCVGLNALEPWSVTTSRL